VTTTLSADGRRWTSDKTSHTAWCDDDGWKVTFLPGYWSRNQAITAMTLAEYFHHFRQLGLTEDTVVEHDQWPHFRSWSRELGMSSVDTWKALADTYPPAASAEHAPEVTAVGALHSECCDAPIVTTRGKGWHCNECGSPDWMSTPEGQQLVAKLAAEQAPAEQHHMTWCAEEHSVAEDCRTDWEGHESEDGSRALVRMLGNDDDQQRRYELHVTDDSGHHATVTLSPRQAHRVIAAFDLD
jgi:hypothetical protein